MKYDRPVRTAHLTVTPLSSSALEKEIAKTGAPVKKAFFEDALAKCQNDPQAHLFHTIWLIEKKKEKEPLGYLRFGGRPRGRETEIDLVFSGTDMRERCASEALRAAVRRVFAADRDLQRVVTWLNRSMPEVRILERAGFERAFEKDGLVRYERERKSVSFLAVFMILGTVCGMIAGKFVKNYPVATAIGICAGILPGALLDALAAHRRKKK